MTDAQYDTFLTSLKNVHNHADWATDGVKFLDSLPFETTLGHLNKLTALGYITANSGEGWRISITQNGSDFINRGGFTKETFLREEPLRQFRLANDISDKALKKSGIANTVAIIALIVSVIAVAVAIIVWQFPK